MITDRNHTGDKPVEMTANGQNTHWNPNSRDIGISPRFLTNESLRLLIEALGPDSGVNLCEVPFTSKPWEHDFEQIATDPDTKYSLFAKGSGSEVMLSIAVNEGEKVRLCEVLFNIGGVPTISLNAFSDRYLRPAVASLANMAKRQQVAA